MKTLCERICISPLRQAWLTVAALIALSCIITSCGDDRNLKPYGWTKVQPEFDSIVLQLEPMYARHANPDTLSILISRLRKIADSISQKPILASRATYWEGRITFTRGEYDKGIQLMEKALSMTDSAKYPYDYHRILWNLDMDYHEPSLEYYQKLLKDHKFFLSAHDDMIAAGLSLEIGCMLNNLSDTEHGIAYLKQGDSLFMQAGMPDQVSNNRLNHADALFMARDTLGAAAMLREILADTLHPVADYALDIAIGNLYAYTGDTLALRQALKMVGGNQRFRDVKCMYAIFMTEEKLKAGDLDSAQYYSRMATENIDAVESQKKYVDYLRSQAYLHHALGRPDSAYTYLLRAESLNDSLNLESHVMEVQDAVLARDIRQLEVKMQLEQRDRKIMYLWIIASLLMLGAIVAILIYRHYQRQKMARVKAQLEMERSNRKMIAMEIVLKEKENLLESIEREMDQLVRDNELGGAGATKLRGALKAHKSVRSQNEGFIELTEKIDTAFGERLRKDYPTLTDADVRIASYVTLGMEMKHIARVMSIRPESVKQARWRLRSKMGLSTGDNLEAILRKYQGN